MTPEQTARKICSEHNLATGSWAKTQEAIVEAIKQARNDAIEEAALICDGSENTAWNLHGSRPSLTDVSEAICRSVAKKNQRT